MWFLSPSLFYTSLLFLLPSPAIEEEESSLYGAPHPNSPAARPGRCSFGVGHLNRLGNIAGFFLFFSVLFCFELNSVVTTAAVENDNEADIEIALVWHRWNFRIIFLETFHLRALLRNVTTLLGSRKCKM